MVSVNRQSLREEFDALKAQFESLCAEGKMSPESLSLFQIMANKGYNPLISIQMALSGQIYVQQGEQSPSMKEIKPGGNN